MRHERHGDDFGGGGLLLAYGMVCGLLSAARTGKGQVVDAAMVDGSAMLMSTFVGMSAMGFWSDDRGTNMLDGGAHFYGVYETADARWISIAAYEPKFYAEFVRLMGPLGLTLDPAGFKEEGISRMALRARMQQGEKGLRRGRLRLAPSKVGQIRTVA